MRTHLSKLSVLFFLLFLPSCSLFDSSALRVTSELPHGVVQASGVLQFEFSRSVVLPESTNIWVETPFIEFTPNIEGKFVWQDSSRLVFSPDAPLAGDTKFKGKLNTDLLKKLSHARSFKGDDEFSFSTEPFTMKGAEFFYDRIDNKRTVGVKANLEFSYTVKPDDVAKCLKLEIDGVQHSEFKIVSATQAKIIPVEIGSLTQLEKPRSISVSFSDGLLSPETNTRITMEKPFVYSLPGLEELKIYGHEAGFDGKQGTIKISTSQEVEMSSVRSFITISPERSYVVEATDRFGFVIRGDFETATSYHLMIHKGLQSVLGAKTQNDYEADIVIGDIKPSFSFVSDGAYMLLSGAKSIAVKTVNLAKLHVQVSQIFQNNIVFFLDHGRSYDYGYYDEDEEGYHPPHKYRFSVGNFGRLLEGKTIDIQNSRNQEVTTGIDLSSYLRSDYKGFLLVEVSDPAQSWRSTAKLISISDIGLIVKQSKQELAVFAASLEDNEPVAGVKIELISNNNQVMSSQNTNSDGAVVFKDFGTLQNDDFHLKLVTATKGDDFNFLNLADYRVETSRFDVGGKFDSEGEFDAFVYGDRTLYRPGEKIILTGIVRDLHNGLPGSFPVKVKMFSPLGTVVSEFMRTINEEGSFEISYQTDQSAPTGEYRFDVSTGNDLFLTSYSVSIEDFVPDRIRVSMTADCAEAAPGDTINYSFQALNFFGPPASGRNYEFEGTFVPAPYLSKHFPEFRFANDGAENFSPQPVVSEGKTDDDGKAEESFGVPKEATSSGVLIARGRVGVFDESGRPVYQLATTVVNPKEYYIGVWRKMDYYVSPGTPQTLKLIAVNPDDQPIKGFPAQFQLFRKEWHTVLRMFEKTNSLRYVSEMVEVPVESRDVTLDDTPTPLTFTVPPISGDYVVRVSKKDDDGYNEFNFYSYSWATTDITSFQIDPEARVDISFNKQSYEPGEKANILFKTPFDGTMLVTLERNRVISYRYLNVENNTASMEVSVENDFMPNVYVSAVLFRKVKSVSIPLLVGHGFAPLFVEKKTNKLAVSISAPEKIRPRGKQKITVAVAGEKNVFVTLAAVDEGILQVKNYATPQPYSYFYARKGLETQTFDFFRDLLPEPGKKQKSSSGGSEYEAKAKRTNPVSALRFKPVALWSGIVRTNSDGEADVAFDIPEFSGELRLMAIAYKGGKFGSAEKSMKVADPVVVTPALPRFASPNDVITMPLTAFNTTEKPVSVKFTISTEGPLIATQQSATLDINANQERYVNIVLRATDQIGKATVKVVTEALGEKFESVTEIPVRPLSSYVTESVAGSLTGGNTVSLTLSDQYLPNGRKSYLTVSPFPVANFAKELKYLVGYPHGCLEQTTSKAFPQIYLRDIAVLLDPSILDRGSPTYFVNEAITKISGMQGNDGRFSYWPGGSEYNNWATVYATHFLVEAKKAGYSVPEATLKSALSSMATIARSKQTMDYYVYSNHKTEIIRIADKSSVYALYVLALAGQPELSIMNFYRTAQSLLTTDTRYLLAGSFALSGDRKSYLDLLPPQFVIEDPRRTSGEWFDSPIRANAIVLNVLLETDPGNANIPRYMDYLSKSYETHEWYSTQDDAFTLLAFGKAARRAGGGKFDGTITIAGNTQHYSGGNQKYDISAVEGKVTFSLRGEGQVYYSLITEGIRRDGYVRIEDKNLRVRREFFNRFGAPVGLESIKQNSLVVVKITATTDVDRLDNIAITDLLPAGFEIENPRLVESSQYDFIKDASTPDYVDIRDDRINYYTNFKDTRERKFFYLVRAVSKGDFQYAPIAAEAMYDANYYSASGRGVLKVVE